MAESPIVFCTSDLHLRRAFDCLVSHVRHGFTQPSRLQIAIVPKVEISHELVLRLAKNAQDGFTG